MNVLPKINKDKIWIKYLRILSRILLLPAIGSLFIVIPFPGLKVWYYLCPMSVLASFISFISIPFLSEYLHSKTLVYDDLLDHNIPPDSNNEKLRKRYQKLYKILLYSVSSILMSVLIYYVTFQFHDSTLDWLEFIGILGGWLSLTKKFFENTSDILLKIVYHFKLYSSPSIISQPNVTMTEKPTILNITHPKNYLDRSVEMSTLRLDIY